MKVDIKEKMPWHRKKFKTVDKIIAEEFKGVSGLGTCHAIWVRKKQLLKEMYNLDWKTPAEMNPDVTFD